MWSAGFAAAQEEQYFIMAAFPNLMLGGVPAGRLGIIRLHQHHPVEIECEPHVLFYIYQESH